MAKQKLPDWFSELDLEMSLLCWLCRKQQRFESAALSQFGDRWTAVQIRGALRQLQADKAIMLMGFDRVTWAIEMRGRNRAARARDRAKALLARKAAA